ncbi:MAG: hypothetical protein AB1352_00420 [Patescibacteria group bacterium]
MLISAYIVPPSPLLLPHIGREQSERFATTHRALKTIRASLAASMPEGVVLISQYGVVHHGVSVNIAEKYEGSLQSFGDLTRYTFRGSPSLAHQLLEEQARPLVSGITHLSLDYASVVALQLCMPVVATCAIVPLYPSAARTSQEHVRVGMALRASLIHSVQRLALIAVGDLSHHVTDASPEEYHTEGALFDTSVMAALKNKSVRRLLEHADRYGDEAKESGILAFLLLLGVLEGMQCTYQQLAYEAPFGVGYLTAEYLL